MAAILVTGATGFIGQHLVRKLLTDGHTVRAIRFGTEAISFFDPEEVEWRNGDLRAPMSLDGICDGIDIVYHLGAISRNDLRKTWKDFEDVNIRGTQYLCEQASRSGVKRFVFISSVEAAGYGDGKKPRTEEDVPCPDNNYGKSKLQAERIVMNGSWPMECVTLRLPMIYGPGTFIIVPKLFGMVKKGFYPFIGNGQTLMEFCYVENAIHAIILAGSKKEARNQTFYVSDGRSYSIKEVIYTISAEMNKKVISLHIPSRLAYVFAFFIETMAKFFPIPPLVSPYSKKPFFTRETVWWTTHNVNIVSVDKIKRKLGYRPIFSIEEGCAKTVAWLRKKNWGKVMAAEHGN